MSPPKIVKKPDGTIEVITEKGFELIKELQEVAGDELDKVEMIEKIRKILMDFLRGYPAWRYFGIIESHFKGELGKRIIQVLKEHNVIEVEEEKGITYYRLKPKGIEIAVSLSNRRDSKRVLTYAQETHKFNRRIYLLTIIIGVFTTLMFLVGLSHLVLSYFQNSVPIF